MGQQTNSRNGFSFDLFKRNEYLEKNGFQKAQLKKTGTTLAGLIFKDGVVLASDTRATAGDTVAEKNCEKLEKLAPNIYCACSGTAADGLHVTGMISSALTLHRHETGRSSRVVTAMTLIKTHLQRYQGHIGAALVLGGVDLHGAHLFSIYPHGSVDALPFTTMGSGCVCAMSILEEGFRDDMSREDAIDLAVRAIKAGIYHDNASGSNVDICVITKEKTELIRPYELLQQKTRQRVFPVVFEKGKTPVLHESIIPFSELMIEDADAMDTS